MGHEVERGDVGEYRSLGQSPTSSDGWTMKKDETHVRSPEFCLLFLMKLGQVGSHGRGWGEAHEAVGSGSRYEVDPISQR